ncbi:MAG TPA: hypothetical protein VGD63_14460 [Steroidobacteraceae bacterium]
MNESIISSAQARLLPGGFEDLEPFAAWSLSTETERITRRQTSSFEEIVAFRNAILPYLERIFSYLEQKPLDALQPPDRRLLYLTLSLAEIAPSVEYYRQPAVIEGFNASRFLPVEDSPLRPKI